MSEERLTELESRLSYQEDTLQVLGDAIARQQKELEHLQAVCRQLLERVADGAPGAARASAAEEPPPHY